MTKTEETMHNNPSPGMAIDNLQAESLIARLKEDDLSDEEMLKLLASKNEESKEKSDTSYQNSQTKGEDSIIMSIIYTLRGHSNSINDLRPQDGNTNKKQGISRGG
jgi:hypothetical protein